MMDRIHLPLECGHPPRASARCREAIGRAEDASTGGEARGGGPRRENGRPSKHPTRGAGRLKDNWPLVRSVACDVRMRMHARTRAGMKATSLAFYVSFEDFETLLKPIYLL